MVTLCQQLFSFIFQTCFCQQDGKPLAAKRPEISWLLDASLVSIVLRQLPVERPDPKLILSPDPDRPLGTPTGK
jgi:hypothetical protein